MDQHQNSNKMPQSVHWGESYVFCTPSTTLLTKQCKSSPPAHQCRVGSSHSGCVSLDTLLVPLPRRTITMSLLQHLDHLLNGWGL